ncbi:MAG TPA: methyl-accepting chemotaxis protein [Spirochaetota bacterium]|nr:methyl-accepting chemotaxis protein [Spirochaetota bacterium]HPI91113.1 methyl-accepting chemotaxis protein [Spirochaetota bacterium]HPR47709.1 methyl-accepting chemotaxis protein [Spirochaetota bacterium]
MFRSFHDSFLKRYDESDYLTFARAKLLFIFQVIFLGSIFALQFSMLFAGWDDFVKTLYITPVLLLGVIISMIELKKGNYLRSANILISFASMAIMAGLIREPFMNPEFALTSYIYFVYSSLALCIVFSTPRFLGMLTLAYIVVILVLFLIMKNIVPNVNMKQLIIFVNNNIFSFIFFFIISIQVTRIFSRNVEIVKKEADRNQRHNDFIKKILGDGSGKIAESMTRMSSKSDLFSRNTQSQAASIEEITATIEEISAGIDSVANIVRTQNDSITTMKEIQMELSKLISSMDSAINDSLQTTGDIARRAQGGEQALLLMERNIGAIRDSSHEMTNIVSIINDISEQVNLLSLNAAIEAARAGEAGRGFAVVADEISKLADRTATSIKDIDALIRANETETGKGMEVIKEAVNTISTIIDGVNSINEKISIVVNYKDKQIETNAIVVESTEDLKRRSEEITVATAEQKNAINEIINSVSGINAISQSNSQGAEELFTDSRELVSLVEEFQKKITDYTDT